MANALPLTKIIFLNPSLILNEFLILNYIVEQSNKKKNINENEALGWKSQKKGSLEQSWKLQKHITKTIKK